MQLQELNSATTAEDVVEVLKQDGGGDCPKSGRFFSYGCDLC